MQRGKPLHQQVVKLRTREGHLVVVEGRPQAGDYWVLPDGAQDVRQLTPTRAASSAFYLSGTGDTIVNFDSGQDRNVVIIARYRGTLGE